MVWLQPRLPPSILPLLWNSANVYGKLATYTTCAAQIPLARYRITHLLPDRSPDDPDGNIVMSIAENRLTVDLLKDKLQRKHTFPDNIFFYDNMTGSDRFKAAILALVHSTFMQVMTTEDCCIFRKYFDQLALLACLAWHMSNSC